MVNYLMGLLELMHSREAFKPLPPPRIQSMQRKAACTHITLSRLYGPFHCQHCGRTPRCGWVYRCTQDYGESLPPWEALPTLPEVPQEPGLGLKRTRSDSDFGNERDEATMIDPNAELKTWVLNAIADGEYSDEQVETLRLQRQKVVETIRKAEFSLQVSQPVARRPLKELVSNSAPNLRTLAFGKTRGQSGSATPAATPRMPLDCTYMSCSSCRPILRDRSWACFEHVYDYPDYVRAPIQLDQRPVSSIELLRSIGTRFHRGCIIGSESEDTSDSEVDLADSLARIVDLPKINGLNEDLSSAFQLLPEDFASVETNEPTPLVEEPIGHGLNVPAHQGDLPPLIVSSETSGSIADEVLVNDGVAVTEEAVDTGTADIIMQV